MLFLLSNINSQNLYQETFVELDESFDNDESYHCQASTSIKMLPGFKYKPVHDKEMLLEIDRYAVFPPEEGYYGSNSGNGGGVVGTLPGNFNVSASGAAVYNIDIKLPNAIGTMMPRLSFVYNSQSGNGIMGWAWNVSGLSSIERVPQTKYHDNKITHVDFVNDRFAMDGQRLMLVGGTYGGDDAEYKTEIDNFDKIVSYSNGKSPEYFKVWKSDGTIWEYGSTKDSRIETQNDDKVMLRWLLSKISDRNGNAILFNYDKNITEGECYINNIEYTCNDEYGIRPAYKILFVYEDKNADATVTYVYGNKVSSKRILKNVHIINNYTGKKLYDYSLEYYEPGKYDETYFAHYRLKSVGLAIGEEKINPTQIIWNVEEKHYPSQVDGFQLYELDKNMFSKVPFIGDFDGDGFSDVLMVPYKIQNTYPEDINAEVYLNNGDGTFQKTPMTTIKLSKELEWIYVFDLNDDGVDDIVTYDMNYNAQTSNDVIATIRFYLMEKGEFVEKTSYSYKNNVTLLLGRFYNEENGVIVIDAYDGSNNKKDVTYIYCIEGFTKVTLDKSDAINGIDANFLALDVNGDGLSEIMVLKDDGYEIYKVFLKNTYGVELFTKGTSMTKDIYPFANDFNGDGKVDLLYYDSSRFWNVVFSKGNGFTSPMSCSNTSLLRTITLNAKDRYRYSLKELEKPTVTIRTADFDGDGLADVGVFKNMAGNYYLEIGLLPYVKSDNTIGFANIDRYYMPINYSHQTIQIGRFLPQENVSILSGLPRKPLSSQQAYIASLYPHSAYYSVERIVDGMGNARGFSYDYLMKIKNKQDDFYSYDNVITDNDIRKISMPISALKTDTIFGVNEKPLVTKYEYRNALMHTKGHGFLGFERMVTRRYVNENLVEKQIQDFDCATMGKHAYCLPYSMRLYYGEKQLIKEEYSVYDKYVCNSNNKVIVPLIKHVYSKDYNLDKEKDVLKFTITNNSYSTDNTSNKTYDKIVRLESKSVGSTDDIAATETDNCKCVKKEYVLYDDDIGSWIINRPKKVYELSFDDKGDMIGSTKIFVYDEKSPKNVIKETQIPNAYDDYSDPLLLEAEYAYDKVGNLVSMAKSSPSAGCRKTIRYEYDESFRYMIKTIDELGREIKCKYDNDYGSLISTIDFNGFVTLTEKDPAGVNDVIVLPDGMQSSNVLRWSSGNEYAPPGSSFYRWEKSTGNAETMVFYHKSGAELRNVKFDINGKAVFVDKLYDDFGNVKQQSLPYYQGDEKLYVTNVYDRYNRLVEVKHPNNVLNTTIYNGNEVISEIVGNDGKRRCRINTYNFMNWLVETKEITGNVIKYEYYSDGLIKSAQIGDSPKTKVSVTYDNHRNKKTLQDANYGLTTYEYDAFGNIIKIMNPKNGVMKFEYDITGRMITRTEIDGASKNEIKTHWVYGEEKGKNGVLKKIVTSENHSVDYVYDKCLRLIESVESVHGEEYRTSYEYDMANRISSVTYPSGITISTVYSNSGYEKEIIDVDDNKVLWKTNDTNANGFITECTFGNGFKTKYQYDSKTFFLENIMTANQNNVVQNLSYRYDDFGNLMSREKMTGTNVVEDFEYDDLDRLLGIRLNGEETAKIQYDELGNIVEKEVAGVRLIYSTMYDAKRPNAIIKAKTEDDKMFLGLSQNTSYSSFDYLLSVTRDDDYARIEYGYDNNRIFMRTQVDGKTKTKTYINNCEIVEENDDRLIHTYINGPGGVFAVCTSDKDGRKSYNYVHKDNLGSWNVITDEECAVVQEVSFDAWGNMRNYDDWTVGTDEQTLLYDRGYTGHEHLLGFGLVNMNGRVYDPLMSMMLSPDNNIQVPQMSQNFNRYSYCMNNPLRYNDPTGEIAESVVMGVVGAATNVLFNAKNIDSFAEFGLLLGVGFVKGFLMEYTMGQSWLLQIGVQTVMGGISSGVSEMVAIGDGSFKFSGDDWNSIKSSSHYGMGNALVWGFMTACFRTPEFLNDESLSVPYYADHYDDAYYESLMDLYFNKEIGHSVTSVIAHGFGCWFSGQPFLETMRFKDVGFDLKMLGHIARRMLSSYIYSSIFADDTIRQRGMDIKNESLSDIRTELPDFPDYNYEYTLRGVYIEKGFVYIIGDIFEIIPGEVLPYYYKPYFEEKVIFPFSYSLLRTIFLSNK